MNILAPIKGRTIDLERTPVAVAQRRWISLLAAMFPIAFLTSSLVLHRTQFQSSISAYYWTNDIERNIFVGVLCFVASYLILYKGYTWLEDRALDLAGVSAVGVAFFPMDSDPGISAHGVFAVIFFGCIFYVCIFMSKMTLPVLELDRQKFFRRCYWACSVVMVGLIMIAVVFSLIPGEYREALSNYNVAFWLEAFGIWAFSAYWYIKSRELDPSLSLMPFIKKRAT